MTALEILDAQAALETHERLAHDGRFEHGCQLCRDLAAEYKATAERVEGIYRYASISSCRLCGAALIWFTTPAGKRLPVDHEAFVRQSPPHGLRGLWTTKERAKEKLLPFSHWASCPKAKVMKRIMDRREKGEGDA